MEAPRSFEWVFGDRGAPSETPTRHGLAQVLAIADELGVYTALDDVFRRAVELIRERLKLERVSFFLYDEKLSLMQGMFGTAPSGKTVDERWLAREVPRQVCDVLCEGARAGELWQYLEDVELLVPRPRRSLVLARGWNAITPLLAGGTVVGVMCADAALSGSAFHAERQTHAALLCGTLAQIVLRERRGRGATGPTRTVRRVLAALEEDGSVQGQVLAREFGVSPAHLARTFKAELGVSLVEYRNHLRLRGFFDRLERGEANLERAASAAGFGSYAQFHRVYRQAFGCKPRDLVTAEGVVGKPMNAGMTQKKRAF